MKFLPLASVFFISLIFAATAFFFTSSANFTAPVVSKAGQHSSVAGHFAKYI